MSPRFAPPDGAPTVRGLGREGRGGRRPGGGPGGAGVHGGGRADPRGGRVRATLILLTALLAGLACAAPARAAAGMEIGMEDERLLLSDPSRAPGVVQAWKDLGIETVRLHAGWYSIAPAQRRLRKPRGFHASDPLDRRYKWSALDQAVSLVVAAGMRPMLTVTGPAPYWATADPRQRHGQLRPNPGDFADFARAVARRYGHLVNRYLIWNEPNQPGWLLPQRSCRGRGRFRTCTPLSPHLYRALYGAASRAIRAADPAAEIVFGELAPVGDDPTTSTWRPMAPLPFLRGLGCVDRGFRPLHAGLCRRFRPLRADSFGYHPHGKKRAPDEPNPDKEEAQIADLPRLYRTLDRLTRMGRLRAPRSAHGRFPIHMTEFGFQTRPPDRAAGVTLAQQASYVQQATYILWRMPRVKSLTHYQWEDEVVTRDGPKSGYGGWQSGLRFFDGRPKPVFGVFAAPFVYDPRRARLWGQVRPGLTQQVVLQERSRRGPWKAVAQVSTDSHGYWTSQYPVDDRDTYRFTWLEPPALLSAKPRVRTSAVLQLATRDKRLRASAGRGS